jgi:hypothetical protein
MDELRLLVIKENMEIAERAGDGGRTEGFLVHRNLFKDKFKVYKIEKDKTIWKD